MKLDKSLEKELIYTLNTDYEKIEKLCEAIFKNRNCLENESDIIRLAVIVGCLKKTKEYYKRLNKRKQNINDYPENTSLQIAAKKYLKNKNKLGMGIGTISI